ncbi:MAG: FAD-dependent oxidoreductase [Candidatus Lokiarchaeota archaeon]|nr:FAD-dependent oxidoreductase [Candidatus Lokiarchaeota archaeon]
MAYLVWLYWYINITIFEVKILKIINNAVIKDKYQCIIIGAGIGGLTAAALLAKKGIDVLLIEQHYVPGGACTSLKRMGQAFDVGAALLFGFQEEVISPHRFIMNTLEEHVNVIQHESMYRCNFEKNGKPVSINFWENFDRFFAEMTAAFPEYKDNMKAFYEYLESLYDILGKIFTLEPISEISMWDKMKMFFKNPRELITMLRYLNKDMKSMLDQYFGEDPQLKTFYDMLLSFMLTTKVEETPIILAAAIFIVANHGGACYPQGSPQALPNAIEKAFEKFGGSILYRHLVDEILIEKKKAYGVRLDDGTEIMADVVISDASIWQNYNKLINKKHLSQKEVDWANSFEPTLSALIMYIGVDAEAIPEGTPPIEMYIEDINNYDGGVEVIYIPSLEDPSIAPEGTHSITVIAMAFEEFPRPSDPIYQSDEYYKLKEKEADRILTDIEKHFPNFRKHIRCIEVGTSSTIERFTLKDWGCIGGPKQSIGQHMMKRPGAKSKFKNLYYVGDSTTMGESVMNATFSAIGATNLILKKFKKKPYVDKKFDEQYVHFVKGEKRILLPEIDEELNDEKAARVAWECQWCVEPQCNFNCPAGVDVSNFMRRIESKNFNGAAKSIRQMNPLGEICGKICPAEKLCEKDCYHKEFSDESTRISQLQAWVCQKAGENGWDKEVVDPTGKKIAIIGAGPSGLSCAHFLARLGHDIDVFEKRDKKGGMLTYVLPSSRLPENTINRDLNGLSLPNINFKYNTILGKDVKISELSKDYDAVYLAPGLWSGRKLNIPGIDNSNIIDALTYIMNYKQKGKVDTKGKLLVIGGGSVAADAVLVAKESGVKDITLVCLESKEEMPALKSEIDEMLVCGAEIHNSWGPKEISGKKIVFMECSSVFDENGKFEPKFNEKNVMEVEFDQIVLAVGQQMDPDLASYFKEEFGKATLIDVEPETLKIKGTSNIYAGGDIIRGAGTVVQSVADGRRAAMAINKELKK